MKVIVTGATGFIGAEVLAQTLAHPAITSVVALSRRELPTKHPKLTTIIHSDFTSYPPSLLSQLAGAEACIYALGLVAPSQPELQRRVNYDFTLAAANAFASSLAPQAAQQGKKFRFVYTSGHYVERDQQAQLWVMAEGRKMRGTVEIELEKVEKEKNAGEAGGAFELFIARPSFVLPKDGWVKGAVMGMISKTIKVDELGKAMVEIGVKEGYERRVWGNDELKELGKSLDKGA